MIKKIFTFIILLLPIVVKAQKVEMGFLAGIASYKGELNPVLFDPRFFQPGASMFFRYNLDRRWALRANFSYGSIKGDDALSSDEFNRNRNLSFTSPVAEGAAIIEFNFVPYEIGNRKYPFTPYLFGGIGLFTFNPQAPYTNPETGVTTVIDLQPLGTEGQGTTQFPDRKEYSLTQFCLPFGMGIKLNVGSIGFGLEVGARKTFTDYLDDVSQTYVSTTILKAQNGDVAAAMSDRSLKHDTKVGALRGNPGDNDWYMFSGLTVYFRLDKKTDGCDSFHSTSSRFIKPTR